MKISREQKQINRQALLQAGLDLMSEEGMKSATMSRIAQRAGLSEPVIYKYYPTKDHLLVEYFAESLNQAIAKIEALPDFATLTFSEQIQMLFDAQIQEFEKNKKFVNEAFRQLFLTTMSGSLTYLAQQRQIYMDYVQRLLDAAIEVEEFPAPPGKQVVCELLWDFHLGMTYYWLNDDSAGSSRTLQMLDKSLGLFNELLKSNVLTRLVDLFYFLAREHFIKAVGGMMNLNDDQKMRKSQFLKTNKDK